jgi:hypothetical protein
MTIAGRLLHVSACISLALGLPAAASAQIANNCDASLWNHVYHPTRLVQIHPCIRVTGTVVLKRPEKDGDIHMQLKLDKQFLPLLNQTNKSRQGGNLVLEPICVGPVTQADAIQPARGSRIRLRFRRRATTSRSPEPTCTMSSQGTVGWSYTQ